VYRKARAPTNIERLRDLQIGDAPADRKSMEQRQSGGIVGRRPVWFLKDVSRGRHFEVVYQPILSLKDRSIAGYEALARFDGHPDVTPGQVFQLAARLGMGLDVEGAALRKALRQADALPSDAYIAVNVSPSCLVAASIREILEDAQIDRIVLEITEQLRVEDYHATNRSLLRLRSRGMRIAVDDIGAGMANWGHLVHLQPDMFKIDGAWTADIEADFARRALVKAIVSLARDLDAVVVAEQLETLGQVDVMTQLGVDLGQGYFFARPAPAIQG